MNVIILQAECGEIIEIVEVLVNKNWFAMIFPVTHVITLQEHENQIMMEITTCLDSKSVKIYLQEVYFCHQTV